MSASAIRALGLAASACFLTSAWSALPSAPQETESAPVEAAAAPQEAANTGGAQTVPAPPSALLDAAPRLRYEVVDANGERKEVRTSALEYGAWLLRNRGVVGLPNYADIVRWEIQAERLGVTPDKALIEPRVQGQIDVRLEGAFGGDPEPWIAELRRANRTEEGYRADSRWQAWTWLLGNAVTRVGRVVPEDKLRREWELLYGPQGKRIQFAGLQREVIVDQSEGRMTRQEFIERGNQLAALAAEELEGLKQQLAEGADFQALVLEHSDDAPSRGRGGRFLENFSSVGWGGGALDEMLTLEVGEISRPLRCRGGVWLLKVVSINETLFEDVRGELEQMLIERGPEEDEVYFRLLELRESMPLETLVDLSDWTPEHMRTNRVLGRVEGREIRSDEFELWLRQTQGEPMLPRFRDRQVVAQQAANAGISITQEEVDRRLDEERELQISLGHLGNRSEWIEALAKRGRTESQWRKEVGERVLMELQIEALMVRDRVIDEVLVRSEWLERYGEDGKRVEARYIRQSIEVEPRREGEGDRSFMRRVVDAGADQFALLEELSLRVQDGEDFGALAKRYSDDAESARLGGLAPGGFVFEEWSDEVRLNLLLTPMGGLTLPQLQEQELYLFEIIGVEEVPFESVRDELRQELEEARPSGVERATFLNLLSRAHPLELLPAFFE